MNFIISLGELIAAPIYYLFILPLEFILGGRSGECSFQDCMAECGEPNKESAAYTQKPKYTNSDISAKRLSVEEDVIDVEVESAQTIHKTKGG